MQMKYALIALIAGLLWSCSTVKHVPEGEYLLNNVKIKVETDSTDCWQGGGAVVACELSASAS